MSDLALVTGGTGFLGRHLVRALVQCRGGVRVLLRGSRDPAAPGLAELRTAGVELRPVGLLDPAGVRAALAGVTEVFHLAGRLFAPGIPTGLYHSLHVDATRTLMEACAGLPGLRAIVHCSTTGVLGPTGSTPADEDAPQRPGNAYEASKAEGERAAMELARAHGLPLAVARPALVYGPGDLHLLGWFRAIARGHYRVVGRGDSLLHPIYVDDVVTGLMCCAAPEARLGTWHLVGDRALPIRELAAAIARAIGRPLPRVRLPLWLARLAAALLESLPFVPPASLPLTRSRVLFMTQSRCYSGARAHAQLGFEPRVALADGLARSVAWYRSEGLL